MALENRSPSGWRRITRGEALLITRIFNYLRPEGSSPLKTEDLLPQEPKHG